MNDFTERQRIFMTRLKLIDSLQLDAYDTFALQLAAIFENHFDIVMDWDQLVADPSTATQHVQMAHTLFPQMPEPKSDLP